MADFTNEQLRLLAEPLHPDNVKTRQRLSYIEGHYVRDTLNRIFGHDGWSTKIEELSHRGTVDVAKSDKTGSATAYTCVLSLRIHTPTGDHVIQDVGYGNSTMYTATAALDTHELATKEAETDSLKRCAVNLGEQFGLSLYGETGREDIDHRARELPSLAQLKEKLTEMVTGILGREPTSRYEVSERAGIRTRDLNDRAALQRALDRDDT